MDMEQVAAPVEIDGTNPTNTPDAAALAMTGDTMADLAAVAKEMGVPIDSNGNVVEAPAQSAPVPAAQPQAPKPVAVAPAAPNQTAEQPATPVEVPEKFQNPDGTPNVEKIEKSTRSVEEALAYYKAKEREMSQAQNRVNNPPATQPVQPVAPAQPLHPLEVQMANHLIQEAAAQGLQLDQRLAIAQAKVMAAGLEAKYDAELNATADIRREMQEAKMSQELGRLIDSDNSLVSPEVADRLIAIKQELGLKTFDKAYAVYLGEQEIKRRTQGHTQQVLTPTPKGVTAKAPPTPVAPVARVQKSVDVSNPHSLSDADLLAEIRKIHPTFRGR